MSSYNNLTIEAFTTGTTGAIADPANELKHISQLRFSTNYPGGLCGEASFYIPRDVMQFTELSGTKRVVFRNGRKMVYEGWITSIETNLQDSEQGMTVNMIGAWGYIAMRRHWRRLWADNRITDDIWQYQTDAVAAEICTVDRSSRLRFTPKAELWGTDYAAFVKYTCPPGQYVERLTYDYALAEGTQSWELRARRSADDVTYYYLGTANGDVFDGTAVTSIINASGTGHLDITLAGYSRYVQLYFTSLTSQTPTSGTTYYGQYSNIMVYGAGTNEPPSGRGTADPVTADVVCKLIVGVDTGSAITGFGDEISLDTSYIGTVGLELQPFIHDRWTPIADIMTEAVGYGDSSYNSWAVGFYPSEMSSTQPGKPVLFLEQMPELTDYEYAIRLDDINVIPPFSIVKDFGEIYNIIVVEYQDENGNTQQITPWDNGYSGLEDATSEATYGDRAFVLNVGQSTAAAAYNSGQRFLAQNKDPKWIVNGPIAVVGYIRGKGGNQIPASEIQSGKRIRIENYTQDLSSTGLTFLISHTEYDDDSETCSISIGPPQDLVYPRFVFQRPMPADEAATASASGTDGEPERLNWKRQAGLTPGTPEWDEAVKLGKKKWKEKYGKK